MWLEEVWHVTATNQSGRQHNSDGDDNDSANGVQFSSLRFARRKDLGGQVPKTNPTNGYLYGMEQMEVSERGADNSGRRQIHQDVFSWGIQAALQSRAGGLVPSGRRTTSVDRSLRQDHFASIHVIMPPA